MGLGELFNVALYQPLLNGLLFCYRFLGGDMGLAIIVLTLVIKVILYYPSRSQIRAQQSLQDMQPKLKALQEKYKNNREEYSKAVMRFYKENKVNPFSSCLPLLIQLPILIALYRVFIDGVATDPATGLLVGDQLSRVYEPLRSYFSTTPLHTTLLGFLDLAKSHNVILAALAGLATFWQSRMFQARRPPKEAGSGGKDEALAASVNRNMQYFLPLITIFISYTLPSGAALYWLASSLFQVGQQYLFLKARRAPIPPATPTPGTSP